MVIVGDNLAARITAILLGSFLALLLLASAVVLWPYAGSAGSGGSAGPFQLPVPEETAAIVEALEASPPATRPLVLKALNTSVASVRIEPSFPPVPLGLRRAREMEWMFAHYSRVLGNRPFRVDLRAGPFATLLGDGKRPSVRLSVGLRDGGVLVLDIRPPALIRSYIARIALVAVAAILIVAIGLVLAIRQTARPVARLALAARRFSIDGAATDLPVSGPRELSDLSVAFNEMQHRIRALVDDRTRVLAAIAHDLRTYLTRLRLRTDFIGDADQRDRAVRDIEEMSLLLDDTLIFAQQSASTPPRIDTIEVSAELRAFVQMRRELGEAVSLDSDATIDVPTCIRCSAMTLRRMLANLTDNALRYGGSATLGLERRDHWVDIFVDDAGSGIPAEALSRLLLPFERLEGSRARNTGGAGLGLSIVKALAEGAGGALSLENRDGGGLRAAIRFPVSEPAVLENG